MNTLSIISKKVLECSLSDKLEILISMRAFILDIYECPWALIDPKTNINDQIIVLQSCSLTHYKNVNEHNIKKLQLSPIDIFIMPKNKRNKLLLLIDNIIENIKEDKIIIFDVLRSDPFSEDFLLQFILKNNNSINQKIIDLYKVRNKESKDIILKANIQYDYYQSCFIRSRINKIKDYWINIWGIEEKYKSFSLIEYLIIK